MGSFFSGEALREAGSPEKVSSPRPGNPVAEVSAIEAEIDERIYRLYDLTLDEIKIVEGGALR